MVIYKYELGPITKLDLPLGAQVLTAQMQHDRLVLWALIGDSDLKEARYFVAINTGASFDWPGELRYISTATSSNGIVWHVFERLARGAARGE